MPEGRITVTIEGVDQVVDVLASRARRALDLRPALRVVGDLLQAHSAEVVRTRGGRIGERWPALAESTRRARKERWGYYKRNPGPGVNSRTPLVWTGGMVRSFQQGEKHHVRRITAQEMEWGSKHPKLAFHQSRRPRKKIPRRPILGFKGDAQRRVLIREPLEMWMGGLPEERIRAESFVRAGIVLRRAS